MFSSFSLSRSHVSVAGGFVGLGKRLFPERPQPDIFLNVEGIAGKVGGMDDIRPKLEEVREWAGKQIKDKETPPWSRFYCMKLNESLCQILYGWESPIPIEEVHSQQLAVPSDAPPPVE